MSYDRSHYDRPHRGGGNRRRYKDDYDAHDRRTRDSFESPEQILKNTIIKLGEVDPIQELPRLAKQIREQVPLSVPVISEGIRIAVTEQPYKTPYYAALLRLLHDPTEGENAESSTSSSLGKQVLEDFWKGFQGYLDKLAWRDVRLCIHFFAHLTVAQVISIESMSALLQSFAAVLDEFGVSYGRGRNAALCAIEGLIISGAVMAKSSSSNTTEIIKTVQNYNDSIYAPKLLVQPAMSLFTESRSLENADEVIDTGLFVLKALDSFEFLPAILVPPEVIELDGLATDAGEDAQVKKEDWPQYFFHLFDNDVHHRKECARLLLEYPKWCVPGTFKPKPGAPEPDLIYHIALITELCKLSPSTVGPAVVHCSWGGFDVENARRFAEWFAVHMSNFGFSGLPDLELSEQHPKRTFMRRALEFEIRLSYHDRVLKTLPEPMQNDTTVISDQTPGPAFEYEDPGMLLYSVHLVINVYNTIRSISIHCLLSIGSRSFSHLNAIERYLPLLRGLAGTDAESKQDILSAVASFWHLNRQMVNIVFDKLMQYQIVDPTDVVGWTFENVGGDAHLSGMRPMSLSAFEWDLLKAPRRNVARVKASVGADVGSIEMDADVKPFKQVTVALKAFASLTREQKGALARTIEGFTVITEQAWEVRATWSADEWNTWETWGWYRHFCRTYSPYLRNYQETLGTVGFAKIEGSTSSAAKLMKKTWGMATGQES
ncbi:armadillo-type protein [Suillus variegatus]|nr:armadillo-type protein [Suillus variegatus]